MNNQNENIIPDWLSFYFMKNALILHYQQKYPDHKIIVEDICEMVGKLLGAHEPTGAYACGGGAGMLRGWVDYLNECDTAHIRTKQLKEWKPPIVKWDLLNGGGSC